MDGTMIGITTSGQGGPVSNEKIFRRVSELGPHHQMQLSIITYI